MINKVRVKIESSIQDVDECGLPEGEGEKAITEADGFFRFSDGSGFLSYTEENEGGKCRTEVSCIGGAVTVRRSGAIESEMYFSEGETHSSIYSIPPYKFDATISTKRIRTELGSEGGKIELFYNMKIGGADKSARMRIWILQASRQN